MISRTNSLIESDDVSEDFNISSSARDNGAENSNVGIYDVGNDKKIDFYRVCVDTPFQFTFFQ